MRKRQAPERPLAGRSGSCRASRSCDEDLTDLAGQLSDVDSLLNDFNREMSDYRILSGI